MLPAELLILAMAVAPLGVLSVAMACWLLCLLVLFLLSAKRQPPKDKRVLWLLIANFLLYAVSLLYSEDKKEGLSFLMLELPMLIFPIGFYLKTRLPEAEGTRKSPIQITDLFMLFTTIMCLITLAHFAISGLFSKFQEASSFNSIYREEAMRIWKKHPTYLSVYIGFAVFVAVNRISGVERGVWKRIAIFALPILLFTILLFSSRGPLLGMFFVLAICFFLYIRSVKVRLVLLAFMVLFCAGAVRYIPAVGSRFAEIANTAFTPPTGLEFNSTNLRAGILHCSVKVIGSHPFTGVGVGDVQHELQYCYATFPTEAYSLITYNSHNQYLQFALATGVLGTAVFVGLIWLMLKRAWSGNQKLFLCFTIFLGICFFSENLLSRQAGIMFFYFFSSAFLFRKEQLC